MSKCGSCKNDLCNFGGCIAGKSYRPSNGTEGMMFTDEYCDKCIHDNPEKGKYCKILSASLMYEKKEEGYPKEWVYDSQGYPTCKAYVNWNWGTDGDPDDPDNPLAPPPPPDPNQLSIFPLYPTEKDFEPAKKVALKI